MAPEAVPPVLLMSGLLVSITIVSLWGVGYLRQYALARSMLDVPNERSSHETPVPRGGGAVIVSAILLMTLVAGMLGFQSPRVTLALAGGIGLVGAVGWKDDVSSLAPSTRLATQLVAASWTVGWIGGLPGIALGDFWLPLEYTGGPLAVIGLIWLTNLYNFMDGIDGLAAATAVLVSGFAAATLLTGGAVGLAMVSAGIFAGSLGFLPWNWPPARIFMGDVGSGAIGFALGAIALAAERTESGSLVLLLVPLGPFICDATFTLFRRLKKGETLHMAHRSHVYQRLVQNGWTHGQVTLLGAVLTIALGSIALLSLFQFVPVFLMMFAFLGVPAVSGWAALRLDLRD